MSKEFWVDFLFGIEATRKRKGEPKKNNHYGEKVEIIWPSDSKLDSDLDLASVDATNLGYYAENN